MSLRGESIALLDVRQIFSIQPLSSSGNSPNITLTLVTSIDMVQEKVLGQGKQNDESAFEQAKDEQISDYIRDKYESTTGSDMPIKDKPTTLDKNTD